MQVRISILPEGQQFPILNPPLPGVSTAPLFPGATVNQPFSYSFTATAGLPPYQNWTEKGALPPGITPLTSADVLSGTPTMTGTFPITVTVDPSTGMFTLTGNMSVARTGHNATLLADGRVLITGGNTLTAELFDPSTGMFTPTTIKMVTARSEDTATLLANGKVLITGGLAGVALATAELYDPTTQTFSATGSMTTARNYHTATLLSTGPNTGKVLVAGGNSKNAVAESYDPVTGAFSTTGGMASTRQRHSATLLSDGTVLMAGGSEFDRIWRRKPGRLGRG